MENQLPNARTRVMYLLDSIENSDTGLQEFMAEASTNTARMNNFEATDSYMLPYNPVSKKCIDNTKRGAANI